MKPLSKLLQLLTALSALTLSVTAVAGGANGVGPVIPKAKGEQCVEDTNVMRRDHMKYLKKHRDETLREGIRTEQYSLKQCLECHAPAGNTAEPTRVEGEHFCETCHVYAGVTIDCFECHATKPEKSAQFHPLVTPRMKALKDIHQPDSAALLNNIAAGQTQTGGAVQ